MISLQELLALPVVRRALPDVIVGDEGLRRPVRWAHVLDIAEISDLLRGGELVLSTGAALRDDPAAQRSFVRQLDEEHASALAIELGTAFPRALPQALVDEARRRAFPLIALRRRARFVEITESVHTAIIDRQLELLRRGEEIHARFTELILTGKGIQEVLAELARVIGNPVVLENAVHQLVAHATGASPEDVALAAWQDLTRSTVADELDERPEEHGAVAVEVKLLGHHWGRLIALQLDAPLDDHDRIAVERAAIVVALQLLGQHHEEQLRALSRGSFLAELAQGAIEEADAARRADALGFPRRHGSLLPLVATWRARGPGATAQAGEHAWAPVVAPLRQALSADGHGALIGPRGADLLIISDLASAGDGDDTLEAIARTIRAALARRGLGLEEVALALGAPEAEWVRAGRSLRRVTQAVAVAAGGEPEVWHDARRSTIVDLLYSMRSSPELLGFVEDQLGPLLALERDGKPVLLQTLRAYLATGGRKAEAARILHLERQSLYHRLARIEAALGISLDDEDDQLALHISLRALELLRGLAPGEALRAGGPAL